MRPSRLALAVLCALLCAGAPLGLARPGSAGCPIAIDVHGDQPVRPVTLPPGRPCRVVTGSGAPLPDPACTPGAANPTLTIEALDDSAFRTRCVRDKDTSQRQKAAAYRWYDVPHPANNSGATQSCELDHLVSLGLGGADSLDNIWPQCGPDGVALEMRFFRQKDMVESYLRAQVRSRRMSLAEAQRGIASDWTRYLDDARAFCASGSAC
jgi:hypothetical protein